MKRLIIAILIFWSASVSVDQHEGTFYFYKKTFTNLDRVLFDDFYSVCYQEKFPLSIALSFAKSESNFNPNAVSRKGARGLMQIMPFWVDDPWRLCETRYNIQLGIYVFRFYFDEAKGNIIKAVKYYNAGPHGKVVNIEYIAEVVGNIAQYRNMNGGMLKI